MDEPTTIQTQSFDDGPCPTIRELRRAMAVFTRARKGRASQFDLRAAVRTLDAARRFLNRLAET